MNDLGRKSSTLFTFFQPIVSKGLSMETDAQYAGDDQAVQQRDKLRESIFLGAVIRFGASRESANVRVRNISSGGMMIDLPGQREKGLRVVVELKGIGRVTGRIAWSTENRAGISFDVSVDPKLARMPVAASTAQPNYGKPVVEARRPGLAIR
jgi:PilZ domain